jgi:hypothetical protein
MPGVLHDGLHAFVRQGCPTSRLVVPVLAQLQEAGEGLTVHSQDDLGYGEGAVAVKDDRQLEASWRAGVLTVPTLARISNGTVEELIGGWSRARWEAISGVSGLGLDLPDTKPG